MNKATVTVDFKGGWGASAINAKTGSRLITLQNLNFESWVYDTDCKKLRPSVWTVASAARLECKYSQDTGYSGCGIRFDTRETVLPTTTKA